MDNGTTCYPLIPLLA